MSEGPFGLYSGKTAFQIIKVEILILKELVLKELIYV